MELYKRQQNRRAGFPEWVKTKKGATASAVAFLGFFFFSGVMGIKVGLGVGLFLLWISYLVFPPYLKDFFENIPNQRARKKWERELNSYKYLYCSSPCSEKR